MIVTFCGHSQISQSEEVEKWLYAITQNLIEQGATTFYLGGYGDFDSLVASVLRAQKKRYPQIELILVLAYLNTGRNTSGYDSTVYPPLETVPRRFAISHRNRWMVESANVVVAYVLHDWGGAATTLRCAKQKKQIIFHTVTRWAAEAAPSACRKTCCGNQAIAVFLLGNESGNGKSIKIAAALFPNPVRFPPSGPG